MRRVRIGVWVLVYCAMWLRVVAADAPALDNAERAATLRAEIARHDELYFKKAAPEISDEAYDRLKRELVELERVGGAQLGSPEKIGDDRSGRFPTRRHGERMLSLTKVYTEGELQAFVKRVRAEIGAEGSWVIEPKYDGLAVCATYERGRLVRVVTRGNGIEGDDVTANARAIRAFPKVLRGAAWPECIELRGEVFATFAAFERSNAERLAAGETAFANPRALAAGSLKLGDPEAVRTRELSVVFHGWGEIEPANARPATQREFHERIGAWGLPGVAGIRHVKTVDEVCAELGAFARGRAKLPFPTDGVVIKLDDVAQQQRLSATEHAPRWAVAYKFSAEQGETRVKAIALQVGRSGVLTPVAELEPVRLGGTTVTRATLHNAAEIARLDVRIGDVVSVEKAGEIIPAIVSVDPLRRSTESRPFSFPKECPACGSAVSTRTQEAVMQYCPNHACVAQMKARLRHFAGEDGVAIRGLGEEMLALLVEQRGVKTPADLYRLRMDDWRGLPGVGAKSAEKLMVAIGASKRAELWRFVHGLGVPRVGVATARILAERFMSLEQLADAELPELAQIPGVGAAQAEEIGAFFGQAANRQLIAELRACGVVPTKAPAGEARGARIAGKVFVLTGTLAGLTRAQAEERILAAGGVIGASVTKGTDFVVAGDDAGEKRKQALKRGIRIIDEAELRQLLADDVTDQ